MKFKNLKLRFVKTVLQMVSKKQTFEYDVSELGDYVDETSPDIMEDLINEGNLKSRITHITNVKGSQRIKLINSSPSLQAATACGHTPEGGMILTDETITVVEVKIEEKYCNKDLNGTWAQIWNKAGANVQDQEPPNFADNMMQYYKLRAIELDENLIMNGDTTSLDTNLVHYDGFKKRWDADAALNVAYVSTPTTAITSANGYDVLKDVDNQVPTIVKRNRTKVGYEILCGWETAQACLDQIYADKDYSANIQVDESDGTLSFILPTTTTRVRSISTLDGTDKVYGVCYKFMFYGTDLDNDIQGFTWKYSDFYEELVFKVEWFTGIAYVWSQYFTRLRLTPVS